MSIKESINFVLDLVKIYPDDEIIKYNLFYRLKQYCKLKNLTLNELHSTFDKLKGVSFDIAMKRKFSWGYEKTKKKRKTLEFSPIHSFDNYNVYVMEKDQYEKLSQIFEIFGTEKHPIVIDDDDDYEMEEGEKMEEEAGDYPTYIRLIQQVFEKTESKFKYISHCIFMTEKRGWANKEDLKSWFFFGFSPVHNRIIIENFHFPPRFPSLVAHKDVQYIDLNKSYVLKNLFWPFLGVIKKDLKLDYTKDNDVDIFFNHYKLGNSLWDEQIKVIFNHFKWKVQKVLDTTHTQYKSTLNSIYTNENNLYLKSFDLSKKSFFKRDIKDYAITFKKNGDFKKSDDVIINRLMKNFEFLDYFLVESNFDDEKLIECVVFINSHYKEIEFFYENIHKSKSHELHNILNLVLQNFHSEGHLLYKKNEIKKVNLIFLKGISNNFLVNSLKIYEHFENNIFLIKDRHLQVKKVFNSFSTESFFEIKEFFFSGNLKKFFKPITNLEKLIYEMGDIKIFHISKKNVILMYEYVKVHNKFKTYTKIDDLKVKVLKDLFDSEINQWGSMFIEKVEFIYLTFKNVVAVIIGFKIFNGYSEAAGMFTKQDFRKRGYATLVLSEYESFLKKKNIYLISLQSLDQALNFWITKQKFKFDIPNSLNVLKQLTTQETPKMKMAKQNIILEEGDDISEKEFLLRKLLSKYKYLFSKPFFYLFEEISNKNYYKLKDDFTLILIHTEHNKQIIKSLNYILKNGLDNFKQVFLDFDKIHKGWFKLVTFFQKYFDHLKNENFLFLLKDNKWYGGCTFEDKSSDVKVDYQLKEFEIISLFTLKNTPQMTFIEKLKILLYQTPINLFHYKNDEYITNILEIEV